MRGLFLFQRLLSAISLKWREKESAVAEKACPDGLKSIHSKLREKESAVERKACPDGLKSIHSKLREKKSAVERKACRDSFKLIHSKLREKESASSQACALKRGMTLLEMLLALSLFAFMFVFIAQTVKQSHRQARKIKRDAQWSASFSNVLDLIRRDFQGAGYFLDINDILRASLPLDPEEKEDSLEASLIPSRPSGLNEITGRDRGSQQPVYPVFLSPYFVFEGGERELEFVSYSFSSLNSSAQWLNIRYFLQNCESLEGEGQSDCLMREAKRYWRPGEREKPEETLVLLRGIDSLEFSYSDAERDGPFRRKWKKEWKVKSAAPAGSSAPYPQALPFPYLIRAKITTGDRAQVFHFPISSAYVKSWNPYDKAYPGFPKWIPPQEKKPARPGDSARSFRDGGQFEDPKARY